MGANGPHMQVDVDCVGSLYQSHCVTQGIRSYYSSEARQLNAVIKATQKENQMEMFINANKSCPSTR